MLDSYTITQYVAACADSAGARVVWREGATPCTDGRTITLPLMSAYATHEDKVRLTHFVKHETCHIKDSDFDKLNVKKPQGILAFINNLLEDHRIDYRNDKAYAGDKANSEEFLRVYAEEVAKASLTEEAQNYYVPLFAWDLDVRDDLWTRTADPFKLTTPTAHDIYKKLHKGNYADVLRNIRNIDDKSVAFDEVYALAERIVREVFDVNPEDMQGEEAEKRIEKANEINDKGEQSEEAHKVENIKVEGMPMPNADHTGDERTGKAACSVGRGEYTPTPAGKIEWYNYTNNTGNFVPHKSTSDGDTFIDEAACSETLANQIRSKLQILSRDRYEYGKKRGKLNGASLYRVGMKDAKGLNERLFKQKIVNKVLDISIQILIDASGSMSGNKFTVAGGAAIVLNNVFSNVLKIPTEILAFTDTRNYHRMFILKEFDTPVSDIRMSSSLGNIAYNLDDNVDGESLVYGYTRIAKRKEKRKMMIVLSDGYPCGGHDRGNLNKYTRDVIRSIEQSPVELIGIGLMHDTSKWYKNNAVISRASETSSTLLSVITNNILR